MLIRRTFLAGAGALAASSAAAQTTGGTPAPAVPTPAPAPMAPAALPPVPAGAVRVILRTGQGTITADLAADKAPITCANFLRYIDHRFYDGATFYRAVKVMETPLYGLIQGGVKEAAKTLKPIAHESTAKTGLSHVDGALSMARAAQGTATSNFFICVGDMSSSMDADPKLPGDNAGYAVFGRVVEGMDVVKKILVLPTSPTAGSEAMRGQMLSRPVPIITARRA